MGRVVEEPRVRAVTAGERQNGLRDRQATGHHDVEIRSVLAQPVRYRPVAGNHRDTESEEGLLRDG